MGSPAYRHCRRSPPSPSPNSTRNPRFARKERGQSPKPGPSHPHCGDTCDRRGTKERQRTLGDIPRMAHWSNEPTYTGIPDLTTAAPSTGSTATKRGVRASPKTPPVAPIWCGAGYAGTSARQRPKVVRGRERPSPVEPTRNGYVPNPAHCTVGARAGVSDPETPPNGELGRGPEHVGRRR